MIVTCPACTSRYKFDDGRLEGRSAKITCPTCDHVFVVDSPRIDPVTLKDTWPSAPGDSNEPAVVLPEALDNHVDLTQVDFSKHGVTLRVRQGLITRDYHSLEELIEALDEGLVDPMDQLSVDGTNWSPIGDVPSLTERLSALWERIQAGETIHQQASESFIIGDDDGDEDAPTMIVRSSSLNLEEELGEDEVPPPPPAEPAFQTTSDDSGAPSQSTSNGTPAATEEPETETAAVQAASGSGTSATSVTPAAKPAEQSGRSVVPIVLLVLVVVAVVALILYTQGLIPGVGA